MKKPMSFRLSEAARTRLAELAAAEGKNATEVIEGLLRLDVKVWTEAKSTEMARVQTQPSKREKLVMTSGGVKRQQAIPKPAWKRE